MFAFQIAQELLDVISNLKNGAIAICGENLFW
jgi:hypothetical protein